MPWREDVIYGANTPALRAALEADEVLGARLSVIPPDMVPRSRLPAEGLLAVRRVLPPESIRHAS